MRVCLASPAVPPTVGGSETLTANACAALARRGLTVDLFTGAEPAASLRRVVEGTGGNATVVQRAPRDEEVPWEYDGFYRAAALHELLRCTGADVVHAFSHDTALAGAVATAQLDAVPLIATFSELATEESAFGLARSAFMHRLAAVDAYVAPSNYYGELARRHGTPADKVHVMVAGVRTDEMVAGEAARGRERLGVSPQVPVITCPSRFTPRKGQDVLVDAHAALLAGGREAILVLAGSTNSGAAAFRDSLRHRVDRLGTAEAVRFVEDIDQDAVPDLLAASDAVVQPSSHEGLGLTALEAMAAGRPVVLTDIRGFDEFAQSGRNCLVVPPGDAAQLADALARLLDGAVGVGVADAARATAERYSLDRMADSLLRVYVSVVAERS